MSVTDPKLLTDIVATMSIDTCQASARRDYAEAAGNRIAALARDADAAAAVLRVAAMPADHVARLEAARGPCRGRGVAVPVVHVARLLNLSHGQARPVLVAEVDSAALHVVVCRVVPDVEVDVAHGYALTLRGTERAAADAINRHGRYVEQAELGESDGAVVWPPE